MEDKILMMDFLMKQVVERQKYLVDYTKAEYDASAAAAQAGNNRWWSYMPKEFNRMPSKAAIRNRLKLIRELALEVSRGL